jgi:hypothetical protein
LIIEDFLRLLAQFCEGNLNLESINGSLITLSPKNDSPRFINDYMPISLLNSSLKPLTKLMATRLQKVIQSVVHLNHYGFINGRTIQDCLAWAFQFMHICHESKREIVILKLDFEEAFDMVEHQVILDKHKFKGFSEKWITWVKNILSSGSFQVLLNGVSGKSFHCKCGVRQGDLLSLLLIVLATDLLQSVINRAYHMNLLKHPLSREFGQDFPIVQCVDDTLIILPIEAL